jgi:hypothetical protein
MSYKPPTRRGSAQQSLWFETLEEMGGQFWPPETVEEEDMPEVGAKYPMMLYDGPRQCIVYDAEERAEAKKNGFVEHPGMEPMGPDKPLMVPVVKHAPYLSQTGSVLNCTMGEWTGEPQTYHYQFRRNTSTPIGTDANEYSLTSADAGHTIDCKLEAVNAAGSAFSVSNGITIPDLRPEQRMPPPIPKPEVKTTVSVQKTVEVPRPAAPTTPAAKQPEVRPKAPPPRR